MDEGTNPERLTERELEVLRLMARGLSNGEIASRLGIGFETAKWHVSHVIGKLGVRTREEAVEEWRRRNSLRIRVSRGFKSLAPGAIALKVAGGAGAVLLAGGAIAAVVATRSASDAPTQPAEPTPSPTPELPQAANRDYRVVHALTLDNRVWELQVATPGWGHWLCESPVPQDIAVDDANQGPANCGTSADWGPLGWSIVFRPVDNQAGLEMSILWGSTDPSISRLEAQLGEGGLQTITLVQPPPELATDRAFFMFPLPPGTQAITLTGYSRDGAPVASVEYPRADPGWLGFLKRAISR